jgi:hypothetical protein
MHNYSKLSGAYSYLLNELSPQPLYCLPPEFLFESHMAIPESYWWPALCIQMPYYTFIVNGGNHTVSR